MSMRTIAAAVTVLLGSLTLLGCGITQKARFSRTDTVIKTHVQSAPVQVQVANGSIEVKAGQADEVQITAVIKAVTQERLEQTMLVVTRTADQTLDISVQWPNGKRKGNEGCSLTITLPDAGAIALKSSNGRLTVTGVGSELKLRTSNGRIIASHIPGNIYGRTSNGRIILTDIGGEVDVNTSNGRLIFTEMSGPIAADTSNGSVQIRLTDTAIGPLDVNTSNGSTTVAIGPGFRGQLALSTSNGRIKVDENIEKQSKDIRKSSATIHFGSGNASRIHTSNGSITITSVDE
jgi:hypothetical protein